MVKIKNSDTNKRKWVNKKTGIVLAICTLLIGILGVYFIYYRPIENANNHLKEISTPIEEISEKVESESSVFSLNEENSLESMSADGFESDRENSEVEIANENNFGSVSRPTTNEILAAGSEKVESRESIVIPSVGLNLKIIKGTNQENMLFGATTMLSNQEMGKGNYALAGHHMPRKDLLFSPLLSIAVGDEIILKSREKEYRYQVVRTQIVHYKEGATVLKSSEDPILTLVTCDKSTVTDKRFIVTAQLI